MNVHNLSLNPSFVADTLEGQRKFDIRLGFPRIKEIKVGDVLKYMPRDKAPIWVTVTSKPVFFGNFTNLLEDRDSNATDIWPGHSKEEVLAELRRIHSMQNGQEKRFGVYRIPISRPIPDPT